MGAFHQKVVPYFRLYSIEYECCDSLLNTFGTLYNTKDAPPSHTPNYIRPKPRIKIATKLRKFYLIFAVRKYKITEYHKTL